MTLTDTGVPAPIDGFGGIDADQFKAAFRNHPAGVAVITADAGHGPVALTATSVFSVSAEPPVLVFSISDLSSSTPTIAAASTVVVHLLDHHDLDLAVLCSTSGIDRFADTRMWRRLSTGEPFFPAARRWIRARPIDRMTAGRSTVLSVLAVETGESQRTDGAAVPDEEGPLVYHDRAWHRIGDHSRWG